MSAGHNGVDQQELASYVSRIEALDGEIARDERIDYAQRFHRG